MYSISKYQRLRICRGNLLL